MSRSVSVPYVTIGLMMVVYICVFVFLDSIDDFRVFARAQLHLAPDAILIFTSSSTLFSDDTVDPNI